MAELSFPFDNADANEPQWQKMARRWLATGVLTGYLNQLAVTADGSAMSVSLATGGTWVEGFYYENDAARAVPIAAADATNPRIDRIVLRLDTLANSVLVAVLKGTPAASPTPVALTQTDAVYELLLADVTVPAAAGVIVAGNVTDRRVFSRNLSERDALAAYKTLIAQTSLTAAATAVEFIGIPSTFEDLILVVSARGDAALGSVELRIRMNEDTAANYDFNRIQADGATLDAATASATSIAAADTIAAANAPAGAATTLRCEIPGYARTSFHKGVLLHSGLRQSATSVVNRLSYGLWRNTAAINRLTLNLSSGSFVPGSTFTLYGRKAA